MHRVTQGYPFSLSIFNIVVDVVVWAMLREVCGPQEALHKMGWSLGEQDIVLYAGDGRIEGSNPIWLQGTLMTLMRMFERVLLYTNLGKTKSMTFNPGLIRGHLSKDY